MKSVLLIFVLILMLFSAEVLAEIRLLVVFDEDGHRIHQVHRLNNDPSTLIQALRRSKTLASNHVQAHAWAQVVWLDATGQQLSVDPIPDPRFARAPVPVAAAGSQIHTFIRSEGVYLLRGPDAALSARIVLLPL